MTKLLIRHGLSEANNRHNLGTPAYGSSEASLMAQGKEQAAALGVYLVKKYGIGVLSEPIATSSMRRTQETAQTAGFTNLTHYGILDEVPFGLLPERERPSLDHGIPITALKKAEEILSNPPSENIWVTHGLVIAGLCRVMDIEDKYERTIPYFCEVREIPL